MLKVSWNQSLFAFSIFLLSSLGILIVFSSHNFLSFLFGLELNSISGLLILFHYSSQSSSNSGLQYFIVNSLASLILLWGLVFCSSYIFVLGLFLKLGLFPFLWWLPYLSESLSYWSLVFINLVQKIIPFVIFSLVQELSTQSLILFLCTGYSLALLNLLYNQSSIKTFLAWSSSCNLSLMLIGLISEFYNGFFYYISYNAVFLILAFFLNSYNVFYWSQASIVNKLDLWMFLFNFLLFCGIPPFLGFLFKVYSVVPFMYVDSRGCYWPNMLILFPVLILIFFNSSVYVSVFSKICFYKLNCTNSPYSSSILISALILIFNLLYIFS